MRKALGLVGVFLCLVCAGAAEAYELVEVQSGGVILVEEDGERLALELAGIWVPDPPSSGVKGHYQGVEARRYVEQLLLKETAYIRELAPRRPGADTIKVKVRIRLGEEGEYDLAVSLAQAGLALFDRASATDPEYLDAIYRAERAARMALRGMHDGGYHGFLRSREQRALSFGAGKLGLSPGSGHRGLQAYLDDPAAEVGSERGAERRRSRVNESAIETIRDWGKEMGLPGDSSALGW